MGTMLSTALQIPEAPRSLQKTVTYTLENQVKMWEDEINFFHSLLTWCLFSCREESRRGIETLMEQLARLRSNDLPALKEKIEAAHSATNSALYRSWQETTEMRDFFYYFDQNLHKLKSQIFQGFPQFGRLQIW